MSLFKSLSGLITPEIISSAASFLGEDESKISKATGSVIPSILGSMLQTGESPALTSALTSASGLSGSLLSNIGGLFTGKSDEATSGLGQTFLKAILGDKIAPFISMISGASGLSHDSTGKLISSIAPLVAGFFGGKIKEGGSVSSLLGGLLQEKDSFLSMIPSGLSGILGISSLSNIGSKLLGATDNVEETVNKTVNETVDFVEDTSKKGSSWLKWLIPLLLLAALAYFFMPRSCSTKDARINTTVTDTIRDATAKVVDEVNKEFNEFTLPSGLKIKGFDKGLEAQIIGFLSSDEYKNASAETLKDKWFDFDNINFVFGSATELTPESSQQIDNLVAILKEYKDVKVKIGTYTDKVGTEDANLKMSQSRATTIKDILAGKGVGSQIAGAEGYGSQFAKVDASASDEARSVDRRVSIRFEK